MNAHTHRNSPAIVWSIAGTDSGGGAGLAADQRATQALGVHLCPVVAAVTAQNSLGVDTVAAMTPELLDAQLAALARDMRPAAIKTGLLGSTANLQVLVRWIDWLRRDGPLHVVVDPVLRATTGAAFADAELLAAYRDELLPRATVVTPNRREAAALLGHDPQALSSGDMPALARALCARGASSVCLTGGDADDGPLVHDYLQTPQASGWLTLPRIATAHHHGTGCTFASGVAAAMALGFVAADAVVLGKMLTAQALHDGHAAGAGAGPVWAREGFALQRRVLPQLSADDLLPTAWTPPRAPTARLDLYAIVDSAERVQAVLAAGVRTVQLRIKAGVLPDAALRHAIAASVAAAQNAAARLFVNDHWALALQLGANGVHLGQEDLLALAPGERARLRVSDAALGLSSHSLWELSRAASMAPAYIACGPVWPTLTKAMPWHAQGLDNLAWWCAMAPAPVVAISGILTPAQLADAARCGADGVCVVRGLGERPHEQLPAFAKALAEGRAGPAQPVPALPHPSL